MSINELQAAVKSLRLGLTQSFVLKKQCKILVEALNAVGADINANSGWYSNGTKFTFNLLSFLKRFLRFTRVNLRVTDRFPPGLGDLRKARSLCNINQLRLEMNVYASEFQVILCCSAVFDRCSATLGPLFSGQRIAEAYTGDSNMVATTFKAVFEALAGTFPEDNVFPNFMNQFINNLGSSPSLEDFDSVLLSEMSYKMEQKLLGMATNETVPFSNLEMNAGQPFREGRFGTIFEGKQGGPMPVCIQKVSKNQLQTLSANGRIKLFQTLRLVASKDHENLIKVQGSILHEGSLYIPMNHVSLSLKDLLQGHGNAPHRKFSSGEMLAVFKAVSAALEFLHKEGVVHGDVRPDNIFFGRKSQQGVLKLALFSYELNLDELHWSTWNEEALVYQAPEILGQKQFSSASDIYSLGICLWEIAQDKRTPFDDIDRDRDDLIALIKGGERPVFGATEPDWLVPLAEKLWTSNAWDRPSAAQVSGELDDVIAYQALSPEDLTSFVAKTIKRREKLGGSGNSHAPPPMGSVISGPAGSQVTFPAGARPVPPLDRPIPPPSPYMGSSSSGKLRPLPPIGESPTDAPPPPLPSRQPHHLTANTADRIPNPFHDSTHTPQTMDSPAINPVGVNGLSAYEVRQELIKFYTENDPDMLRELTDLVNWCMTNGLEEFDKLLVERFGRGLAIYRGKTDAPPTPPRAEDAAPPRGRGGLASIFKPKPSQDSFGFDKNAPPPMPDRPKPPGY